MKAKDKKTREKSALRLMRMRRGLCQSQLSRLSGITQCAISRMELNGIKRADKLVRLAQALQCSTDELLETSCTCTSNKPLTKGASHGNQKT